MSKLEDLTASKVMQALEKGFKAASKFSKLSGLTTRRERLTNTYKKFAVFMTMIMVSASSFSAGMGMGADTPGVWEAEILSLTQDLSDTSSPFKLTLELRLTLNSGDEDDWKATKIVTGSSSACIDHSDEKDITSSFVITFSSDDDAILAQAEGGPYTFTAYAYSDNSCESGMNGDGALLAASASETITVIAPPSVFAGDDQDYAEDAATQATTGNVLNNDGGASITATAIRTGVEQGSGNAGSIGSSLDGDYGRLTLSSNGDYSYVPFNNSLGSGDVRSDVFTYTITEGGGATDAGQITIAVLADTNVSYGLSLIAEVDPNDTSAPFDLNLSSTAFNTWNNCDAGMMTFATECTWSSNQLTIVKTSGADDPYGGNSVCTNTPEPDRLIDLNVSASISFTTGVDSSDNFDYRLQPGTYDVTLRAYSSSDCNAADLESQITTNITIASPGNDAPTAVDDTGAVNEDATLSVAAAGVLTNDTDADGDPITVTDIAITSGASGTIGVALSGTYGDLTIASDGSYTYLANNANSLATGATATDSFTYTVSDGVTTATATIVITVTGLNDQAPTAVDDTGAVNEDATLSVAAAGVLTNDSDADGDAITVTAIAITSGASGTIGDALSGTYGDLTIASDGSYTYLANNANDLATPATATDSFTYTVSDGVTTATATLVITITAKNDPPILTGDLSASLDEGANYTLTPPDVFYTDSDDDNAGVTFIISALSNGIITVSGSSTNSFTGTQLYSGAVTFVHDDSETVTASFNILVDDNNEDGSTPSSSPFNLTVNPVNDRPVISDVGETLFYTLGNAATVIDNAVIISDSDNTQLVSAAVQITTNYEAGEDLLELNSPPSNFSSSWDTVSGTLTITAISGSDALENLEAALELVTFRNSNGASANTSVRTVSWTASDAEATSLPVTSTISISTPPIDHYNILIEGKNQNISGNACKAFLVTLEAHKTNHQPVNLTGYAVTLGVSGGSGTYTNAQLTFAGTSSVSTYLQLTSGTYTVTIDRAVPNIALGSQGVDQSPTITVTANDPSITFTLDNPPLTAGGTVDGGTGTTESLTLSISSAEECGSTPDANVAQFSFECLDPSSCQTGQVLEINGTEIAENSTPQTNIAGFSASTAVQLGYSDAGQITLHARATITPDNSAPFIVSGSTTLTSLPNDIVITSLVDASDTNNVNPLGSAAFLPAGENFALTAESRNSDGNLTPNFNANATLNLDAVIYPSSTLMPGTFGSSAITFSNGQATHSTDYSEVGSISANLISNYFGVSFTSSNVTIGRFYPADFELSGGLVGIHTIDSCSIFTYFGEPALTVDYQLTAKNADGGTTTHYDPNKGYATPTPSLMGYAASYNLGYRDVDLAFYPSSSTRIGAGTGSGSWTDGVYTYTTTDASLARQLGGAPENPLSVDFGVRINDSDFTTFTSANFSANEGAACSSCTGLALSGRPQFYSGRIVITSGSAPDDQNLPIPLYVERYQDNRFSINGADSCTRVARARIQFAGQAIVRASDLDVSVSGVTTSGSFTDPYNIPPITNDLLTTNPGFLTFSQGTAGLSFSAPCSQSDSNDDCNVTGSFSLQIDLQDLPWLEYDWDPTTSLLESPPSAYGSFGGYRGHDKIINWREVSPGSD